MIVIAVLRIFCFYEGEHFCLELVTFWYFSILSQIVAVFIKILTGVFFWIYGRSTSTSRKNKERFSKCVQFVNLLCQQQMDFSCCPHVLSYLELLHLATDLLSTRNQPETSQKESTLLLQNESFLKDSLMTKNEAISLSCQTELACLSKEHELFARAFSTFLKCGIHKHSTWDVAKMGIF